MLVPYCIRNALLILEKNSTRQVSATVACKGFHISFSYNSFAVLSVVSYLVALM